ncbi:hypothetical protein BT69DRAFT_1282138 [Atractiella rhizophila]|nr:hypothetical protein BT69DRAFT_1282138 [Atractiella rhizophila]
MSNITVEAATKPPASAVSMRDEEIIVNQGSGEMRSSKVDQSLEVSEATVGIICSGLTRLDDSSVNDGSDNIASSVKSMISHFGVVSEENEVLRVRNTELETHIQALRREVQYFQTQAEKLQLQLQTSQQQYDVLQRDFSATRSFGTLAETADVNSLATLVGRLNRSIEDIAARIADEIPSAIQDTPLSLISDQLVQVLKTDQQQMRLLSAFQEKNASCGEFFEFSLRIILLNSISEFIFQPFRAGIIPERLVELEAIHSQIRKSVPQAYASRWRSLTYSHLRSDLTERDLIQSLATTFTDTMGQLFQSCFMSGMDTNDNLVSCTVAVKKSRGKVESLILKALTIQHQIQTAYLSDDLHVYYDPTPTKFDGKRMTSTERSRSKHNRRPGVVAVLGFGLVSSSAIEVNKKIERTPEEVHLKFPVLLYEAAN